MPSKLRLWERHSALGREWRKLWGGPASGTPRSRSARTHSRWKRAGVTPISFCSGSNSSTSAATQRRTK
eukprot:2238326-Alexandrium_andersonii.AAC.1